MAQTKQPKCGHKQCGSSRLKHVPIRKVAAILRVITFALTLLTVGSAAYGQTYRISTVTPTFVAAGANGVTLQIAGTLPDFSQGYFQVCFYTGYGSTTGITPSVSNGVATIAVPASSIQSIPTTGFTAADGYSVPASIFIQYTGVSCSGAPQATLTNVLTEPIAEPLISAITGSSSVPQTNSATAVQAPPTSIVLSGRSFTSSAVVTFGTFGTAAATFISPTTVGVMVPAAFASSPVGTTAALTVCNGTTFCSGVPSPVTLTVTALVPSTGTLTVTPTPTTTTGTTTLTAQFKKQAGSQLPEPGVPSGTVTFAANGSTVSTAPLTLDTSATLVAQSSTTTVATAATPAISPAAGTYPSAQTINITDASIGATIYYTLDGSTPTTSSRVFTQPFVLSSTATVTAIAVSAGAFNSASASATYTIFVPTPTSLSFTTQPVNTATTTPIAPAVTVAILDQNGNVITNSTAPVTIAIATNPGSATLNGTLTVNAVNGVATFSDLSITTIANGYTLRATSGTLPAAVSTAFNITPYPITVKLFDPLIGVTSTLTGSFTLTHPAPAGGVTVSIASSDSSKATVSPATVSVAAGGTTGTFSYTGVAVGAVNITASAPNYLAGSASVTVTQSLVSLGTIQPVAPGQTISLALSIATNAPAGGVTVNFTSSNTAVATVTSSVFIPAGQRTAAINPQITGTTIGSTTINATAQGYAPDTRTVNVTVTASFNPGGITINQATSTSTTLNISAPAQAGGLTFTLTSDTPAKATVPGSVTIPQGQTSVLVPVTGLSDGSTVIRANSTGVSESTLSVNVSSQASFYYGNTTTGVNLQEVNYPYLPSNSPTPITVTVTSSNPAVATVSKSATTVGTSSLTFTNVTSAGTSGAIYIQGQALGTATFTVSAPGYTSGTMTVTVNPSGFSFAGAYNGGLSTTTFSSATSIPVYTRILSTGSLADAQGAQLNPGLGSITVPVTSSNTATGTITTSPVTFNAGDQTAYTNFQPSGAGTTTIAVGAPTPATGFSTSSNYTSFTATVTAPQASFYYGNTTTGVNLQVTNYLYLPQTPPSGITLTVTSSDPTVATVSKSASVVGTATIQYTNVTNSGNTGPIYIQGLKIGTTTFTLTAPGFTSGTITVTVNPSGFTFAGGYSGGLSTTTFSSPSGISVYPTILSAGSLTYSTTAQLNPGLGTITLPITSSNTVVGTISTSPVSFNATDTSNSTSAFQPTSAGTTTITLGSPSPASGFSTPANYTNFTATVTAPQAGFYYGSAVVGANLQTNNYANLPVTPPNPVTVTVTSNGPSIATVSTSSSTVGTTSVSFPYVTSSGNISQFYIQGQSVGSTTFTVSAPGYTNGTMTVTVYPSGFTFAGGYNGGLSTTSTSSPSQLTVYPSVLNPGTLTYYTGQALNPGLGGVRVPVVSSNTAVGTITTSPLIFTDGSTNVSTNFKPVSAGTSTITITQPTGFTAASQYTQINATVTTGGNP